MAKRNLKAVVTDPIAKEDFIGAGERKPEKPIKKDNRKRMNLFLDLDQILALERIRAKRLQEGAELGEVDKSKLIREAIELLKEHEGV